MSWFRKFVYFCVQVDRDELEQTSSSYERTLIYASFMRQMLGAFFVFAVFLYAWSILLPLWMAIAISALLAAIVFFIDQAIISSEWMFHKEFFRSWILNAPINFFFKLLQLLPRAVYAVIIAAFMSTLAEITIQSRAIERSLRETTREANQEYFQRKDTLQANQRAEIEQIEAEIARLEAAIAISSDPNVQDTITVLNSNTTLAQEEIAILSARQTSLRTDQGRLNTRITELTAQVEAARGRVQANEEQMRLEESAERCRAARQARFDVNVCRQRNWRRFRDAKRAAETQLTTLESDLSAATTQLQSVRSELQATQAALGAANTEFGEVSSRLREVQTTSEGLPELEADLVTQETLLADTRSTHTAALTSLEAELRATGYYEEADYGPLELYVGLKRLHHPPIPDGATDAEIAQLELEGEAARTFSSGLWYVIILFELSPVLVAFLGSPFSHLAMRMRRKRDEALLKDMKRNLKRKKKESFHREKIKSEIEKNKEIVSSDIEKMARKRAAKDDNIALYKKRQKLKVKKKLNDSIYNLESEIRERDLTEQAERKVDEQAEQNMKENFKSVKNG